MFKIRLFNITGGFTFGEVALNYISYSILDLILFFFTPANEYISLLCLMSQLNYMNWDSLESAGGLFEASAPDKNLSPPPHILALNMRASGASARCAHGFR